MEETDSLVQSVKFEEIKWWHRIDLGNGVVTPGVCDSLPKLAYSHLPERMDGLRVLDIGAWDGWWSFLCERRGAKEVVALDRWPFDTGRAGFDYAKAALSSKVRPVQMDAHSIEPGILGDFDLVLCLGALHHFRNPVEVVERIRSVCRHGKLILETHIDLLDVPQAACAFYEGAAAYNDPTIIWGPNPACVKSWLRRAGFTEIEQVGSAPKAWEGGGHRATFHAI